jgi:hypothetical protein
MMKYFIIALTSNVIFWITGILFFTVECCQNVLIATVSVFALFMTVISIIVMANQINKDQV